MGLFDVPTRPGRQQAASIARKSNTRSKNPTPVVRKGSGSLGQISTLQAVVEKSLGQYKDDYIVIREEEVLHDYISECVKNRYIALDTETDGLDPYTNIIAGICPYTYGQKGAYLPLNHISYITGSKVPNQLPADFVIKEFERLLKVRPEIDMFNANFDIRILRQFGLSDIYCTWDGYLAGRLLNENEPQRGLKALHNKYCLDGKGDAFKFDDLFKGIPFTKVPINTGYLYAAHDPVITSELCDYQRQFLGRTPDEAREDLKDVSWVFHNIEMPCVKVVCDMEDAGVAFDKEYAHELSEKYHKQLEERERAFHEACDLYRDKIDAYRNSTVPAWNDPAEYKRAKGFGAEWSKAEYNSGKRVSGSCKLDDPINIASPTQLAILFYDILKVGVIDKKSPRGTGEPVLAKIDNPIAKAVLEYRTVNKLLTTYIDKLPNCANAKDGRVHCSFNQYGADTGRFSSQDPNLQNIPSKNHDIRKMFKATDGYVLMSSDYSQQEPKIMTQMCGDPKMIQAYQEGKDLYAEIAALSFNTTYENCLEFRPDGTTNPDGKNRRSQAKSILLGVLYGRGVPSIAEQLGTTTEKAQAIKDSVFKGFPAIPQFADDSKNMAYEKGYVTTLWGRKRRLPDLQLPEFEFRWKGGSPPDDLLDFSDAMNPPEYDTSEVPEALQKKYLRKLRALEERRISWDEKLKIRNAIFREAEKEDIVIINNGMKIADAQRQCVNSRIQGSAADMSKLAMVLVGNDARLKELGFRLLIPVHDELIGECPKETAKEASERFTTLMSQAAGSKLTIPIKCDVEITERWYGEEVKV